MQIKVAQRYRPFTHAPGSYVLLPDTSTRLQIFPALIKVDDLSEALPKAVREIPLSIDGPVEDFTVQQDLERRQILVWGNTRSGFMRYQILSHGNNDIQFKWEKVPNSISPESNAAQAAAGAAGQGERLSLGSHKAQCWEKMNQRNEMTDILPLWLMLGSMTPSSDNWEWTGTASLLRDCEQAIQQRDIEQIAKKFKSLFLAGFETGLSPTLIDLKHQGFHLPPVGPTQSTSPLLLLTDGAKLIRSLFIQRQENHLHILPALPVEFHCGRYIRIQYDDGISIDLEWSKKTIRRMILHSTRSAELIFHFQKGIKRFRLSEQGSNQSRLLDCNSPVVIEAGKRLFFDCFE